MTRPHFFDLDPSALAQVLQSWGLPRFRASQLLKWVYEKGTADVRQMTDLSQRDRDLLAQRMTFTDFTIAQQQLATDGTAKLLLQLAPGQFTECVMIPSINKLGRSRRTACISSQVGCPVGCTFCASGLGGLEKNLTAGQIVEQVWWLNSVLAGPLRGPGPRADDKQPGSRSDPAKGITNIVFMGMGEPLSNFENVTSAIRTLTAPWGLGMSGRKITVSTVGLPAQIRRLAALDIPLTLAISLHAPNDELRRTLIPWAQYTTIDAILDAARYYFEQTGREVTLEYILLRNVNDRPEHARQLATVARTLRGSVNLIRYNEVRGLPFDRPTTEDVRRFQQILRERGVNARIRASRGRDIAAACGQLRHEASASPGAP
jgi:23S rRNA (adenine2503-C2)-methyltransferase